MRLFRMRILAFVVGVWLAGLRDSDGVDCQDKEKVMGEYCLWSPPESRNYQGSVASCETLPGGNLGTVDTGNPKEVQFLSREFPETKGYWVLSSGGRRKRRKRRSWLNESNMGGSVGADDVELIFPFPSARPLGDSSLSGSPPFDDPHHDPNSVDVFDPSSWVGRSGTRPPPLHEPVEGGEPHSEALTGVCSYWLPGNNTVKADDCTSALHFPLCWREWYRLPTNSSDLQYRWTGGSLKIWWGNISGDGTIPGPWGSSATVTVWEVTGNVTDGFSGRIQTAKAVFNETGPPPWTLSGLNSSNPLAIQISRTDQADQADLSPLLRIQALPPNGAYGTDGNLWLGANAGFITVALLCLLVLTFTRAWTFADAALKMGFLSSMTAIHCIFITAFFNDFALVTSSTACKALGIAMHFLYLSCFSHLAMEALHITGYLIRSWKSSFTQRFLYLELAALSYALVFTAISAAIASSSYTDYQQPSCWLVVSMSSTAFWLSVATILPLVIFLVVFMIFSFFQGDPQDSPYRASLMLKLDRIPTLMQARWVLVLEALLILYSWALGVCAFHYQDGRLIQIGSINVIITTVIVLFHVIFVDESVREALFGCCERKRVSTARLDRPPLWEESSTVDSSTVDSFTVDSSRGRIQTAFDDAHLPNQSPSQMDKDSFVLRRTYNFSR